MGTALSRTSLMGPNAKQRARSAVLSLCLFGLVSGLAAPSLGHGALLADANAIQPKPSLSKARAALKSGRVSEARDQYARLLKTGVSGDKRAEALYWVGMLSFAPEMDSPITQEAESALSELERSFPSWERTREAAIVLALARRATEYSQALQTQRSESARLLEACRHEHDEIVVREESSSRETESLKTALEACRTEGQGLRDEMHRKDEILKGKDEALKKVKEVLVDWKAPR